jgi:hypothetical protein
VTYDLLCLQNRHFKWVTGKILFLKGLWLLKGKAPAVSGAHFDSVLIITGWMKLLRNADVVDYEMDTGFGGLTKKTGGRE